MDFEDIFVELKKEVFELAKSTARDYASKAKEDADDFLDSSKSKLKEWVTALSQGKIDKDEFKWLVNSQKSLAKMKVLTQAGLGKIEVDKFRDGITQMIINVVFEKVL